jgi:hypothetical protein
MRELLFSWFLTIAAKRAMEGRSRWRYLRLLAEPQSAKKRSTLTPTYQMGFFDADCSPNMA